MNIAILSANLGEYEREVKWPEVAAPPGVTVTCIRFTDANLPPRPLAMTSRLQCGLIKMFGPEFASGFDVYIWIDASCAPTQQTVLYFLKYLGLGARIEAARSSYYEMVEMAVFRHPERDTIRAEVEFILRRMGRRGERYLNSRYRGEWIKQLYRMIEADESYRDDALYASTAFAYRRTERVRAMLKEWWFTKTRWCLHDQIAWPWLIARYGISITVIPENYLTCPALTFTRRR